MNTDQPPKAAPFRLDRVARVAADKYRPNEARAELEKLLRGLSSTREREAFIRMVAGESPQSISDNGNIPIDDVWNILDKARAELGLEGRSRKRVHDVLRRLYVATGGSASTPEVAEEVDGPWVMITKRRSAVPPREVPQAIEDVPGEDFKPDPAAARTPAELRRLLVEYWEWAGEFGSRRVAAASGGAFSHATAAKLIAGDSRVPLRLEYVAGMIRGCGGGGADQQAWVTAFRRVKRAARTPRLKVVGE